ncbi:MAG: DarT ssDNA thymidine ADP-ribosyltransferase family protein [Alcanivorax sp.]
MQNAVIDREIKTILHFTRLSNLDSILSEGIVSRAILESRSQVPTFNDQYRIDGHREAICCSISFPNYKMLWGLRQQNPNEEWVILALKKEILWEKDCAFCIENAASNNVTNISIEDRKGLNAFNQMFEEIDGKPDRNTLGIPDKYPTNPQAEVLVFDTIETDYILGVFCQSQTRANILKQQYTDFHFKVGRSAFRARTDYRHWQ